MYFQEKGSLRLDVKIQGISAGSLSAALLVTNSSFSKAASYAIMQAKRENVWTNPTGLGGIWGDLVEEWLQELIPSETSAETLSSLFVVATPFPLGSPKLLHSFPDKKDLINACLVSSHIPFFMNGKLSRNYNNRKYIDGEFWPFVTRGIIKTPLPPEISADDVYSVSWTDDIEFAKRVSGSFVSLISVDGLYEMIEAGYKYMEQQDKLGELDTLFLRNR